MARNNTNMHKMVQVALLMAITVLLAVTPLGYLPINPTMKLSFLIIPVGVGAILMGPGVGALLGATFGVTSFLQCFGLDAFGTTLMGISAIRTFLVCVPTRILAGWLTGVVFKALSAKHEKQPPIWAFAIASTCSALLNTVFFVGLLMFLFGHTEFILNLRGGMNLIKFLAAFIGINGLLESVTAFVVGTPVSKVLYNVVHRK